MTHHAHRRLAALAFAAFLFLSACTSAGPASDSERSGALTWGTWSNYSKHKPFLDLLEQTCPDIELEFLSYTGGNATGYSWAQMRADDIPDIFITSRVLDRELAKERLLDLSGYEFINHVSTAVLDQISIDGGIYLLPVNNTMYGIYYNKTLMEEHDWEVPANRSELEALCAEIRAEGLIPGVVGTMLTGGPFTAVLSLAKTSWFTTPMGVQWEQDFLTGEAAAQGTWEETMELVQAYIDMGMLTPDPEDRTSVELIADYLGNRKAVFCTVVQPVSYTTIPGASDELGMMPYIGEDGSKNVYIYSPFYYFGLSKRLAEPGNEEKLEDALELLSLLYSPEGQAALINETTPCVMGVLDNDPMAEDALLYDAQQAQREGRVFPMTYENWDKVLSDMGQAFKEWFRGENGMDGPACIARMDELQRAHLEGSEDLYFCESTADFTLEETAVLLGKALGSSVDADAALIPLGGFHNGVETSAGVTGKLYAGRISSEVSATITTGYDGKYGIAELTGAQIQELLEAGFDPAGDGIPFPYVLVTKGGGTLEAGTTFRVAFVMNGYTEEAARTYGIQEEPGSVREFLRTWLTEQRTVSPGGNPWE